MKHKHDRVMQAKRIVALISASSVTIDQAINVAQSSIGGTVFDAKIKEVDERVVWRIKLLTSGREVKVYIDGKSGRLLEAKAKISVVDKRADAAKSDLVPNLQSATR